MSKKRTSIGLLKYNDTFLTFKAGATIFKEGDPGLEMFVVKSGSVELQVLGRTVETLESGDFLGEMALIDAEVRSASAVAITDCQLVPINREKFLYLVKETPYTALEVMEKMAQRLRRMNRATAVFMKDAP